MGAKLPAFQPTHFTRPWPWPPCFCSRMKKWSASSTGNHLDARRLVFEAATPGQLSVGPQSRTGLGVGTSIISSPRAFGRPPWIKKSERAFWRRPFLSFFVEGGSELALAYGLQAVAPDCWVVVFGILVADAGARVGVAEEDPAAPEPGHAAIHKVVAAAEGSGAQGDPVSQVVPTASEAIS
jgi:hypothetical protein